jgi:hypothetical protein
VAGQWLLKADGFGSKLPGQDGKIGTALGRGKQAASPPPAQTF